MKAAVFYNKRDIRVEEVLTPEVSNQEVLIKVHACGICGTDVHIFEGDEGAAKSPYKTILGHEFAGEIVAVGSNVKSLKLGERVCVDPNQLCGECYYCRSGIGHFCEKMKGYGTTVHGGFAEYCVIPESQAYCIPDTVSYEMAAMSEPVACCLHGIDMCDIHAGDYVVIFGAGMIGLIMLQLAKKCGAAKVVVIEPIESKRKEAMKLGATLTIDPLHNEIVDLLNKEGIEHVNVVIECVGRIETMEKAIEIAGNKSTVMLFGLTKPDEELSIKPFQLFKKEVVIKSSYINPYTQQRAIDCIESGNIDVESMINQIIELGELPKVLADATMRNKGKIIVGFK